MINTDPTWTIGHQYRHIFQLGDQIQLTRRTNARDLYDRVNAVAGDKWSQYNPQKPWIAREGLCILNERGTCGPGPALDSLTDYNNKHGTKWKEEDFAVPTELLREVKELQDLMGDMVKWSVRSHFLKLKPGGFFPPHRDHVYGEPTSFRLIVPIANCNPPNARFMIEDRTLFWEEGTMYAVDTAKMHTLFNASPNMDSVWLVINARVCDQSVGFVSKNLAYK